jgi:hypothetical protein
LGGSWDTHLPGMQYAAGFAGRSQKCLAGKKEERQRLMDVGCAI